MATLKEENKQRIDNAYLLTKFGLKIKPKETKASEIFAAVAEELGYSNAVGVSNIYYGRRKAAEKTVGNLEVSPESKNDAL